MTYGVRFLPEALDQLKALYGYLAEVSSPRVAAHYVEGIEAYCEGLGDFPHRARRGRIFAPACVTASSSGPSRGTGHSAVPCTRPSGWEAGAAVPKG